MDLNKTVNCSNLVYVSILIILVGPIEIRLIHVHWPTLRLLSSTLNSEEVLSSIVTGLHRQMAMRMHVKRMTVDGSAYIVTNRKKKKPFRKLPVGGRSRVPLSSVVWKRRSRESMSSNRSVQMYRETDPRELEMLKA